MYALAEEDRSVQHVEREETCLEDRDYPHLLDLDTGEGASRDEDADLVTQVKDNVCIFIHKFILPARFQINDLLNTSYSEGSYHCVLKEVD